LRIVRLQSDAWRKRKPAPSASEPAIQGGDGLVTEAGGCCKQRLWASMILACLKCASASGDTVLPRAKPGPGNEVVDAGQVRLVQSTGAVRAKIEVSGRNLQSSAAKTGSETAKKQTANWMRMPLYPWT